MANSRTSDSNLNVDSIKPRNFAAPLEELIDSAANTQGFRDYKPEDLGEMLSNVRGLKARMLDGLASVSAQANKVKQFDGANEVIITLSELTIDMETIERRIVDRLLDGAH